MCAMAAAVCCCCCCRKHDLWVLSNHPLLKAAAAAADSSGPYDRLSQPWVVLARWVGAWPFPARVLANVCVHVCSSNTPDIRSSAPVSSPCRLKGWAVCLALPVTALL